MSRRTLLLAALPPTLLIAAACAHKVHTVGTLNPEHPEAFGPGASFCVAKSPEVEERDWDVDLPRKLEKLLTHSGYKVSTSTEADYFLFYDYRIKALMSRIRFEPISGTQSGMETVPRAGPFIHTLALRVIDGEIYRDSGEETVIWQGGAVMSEVPTEGYRFHDLVLVAAFEQFGGETSDPVTLKMRLNDPRARKLRDR